VAFSVKTQCRSANRSTVTLRVKTRFLINQEFEQARRKQVIKVEGKEKNI
jgi:hypothetical protein